MKRAMPDYRKFLEWIGEAERHEAVYLLESLVFPDTDGLAMVVARVYARRPPSAIKVPITPLGGLALAVTLINAGIIDHTVDPTDPAQHERLAHAGAMAQFHLRGVYPTEQAAAFAAVRQLGGARTLGIPEYQEQELGDTNRVASDDTIGEVAEVLINNHAWYWKHALGLGWVLYHTDPRQLPDLPDLSGRQA